VYITLLLAVLCLGCPVQALYADALADLPGAQAGRLTALPVIGLEALDADSRAQLVEARARVATALAGQVTDNELAEAYGELGALYQVQHVNSLAESCYDNAMLLAPDEFRWIYYSAYLHASTGELERAIAGFEQARRLRPDYLALRLRLADAWRDQDKLDQAQQAYLSVVDADGLQAAAHYGLGQIALLRRDYANAIEHFRHTLALQPGASRVHYSLAQALRAGGDGAAAAQHLEQLGDTLPAFTDPQIDSLQALRQGSHMYFIRAMKASRTQDFTAARDAFREGLAREPDNVNARISYARTLYLTGDRARARQELEDTLQQQPPSALALFLLGILDEEDGDQEAATRRYEAALQADPQHSGAQYYLANARYREDRLEQAAAHYAACIETVTDNPGAFLAYTGVLLQTGQAGQARTVLAQAREKYPELTALEYLQVQLQALTGTEQDSRDALAGARKLVEARDIPPHRELQALALAATGDFEAAVAIQQALVTQALWGMPTESARLERNQASYTVHRLPGPLDLFTRAMLQPPAVQGRSVFLDYPTPRPY